MNTPCFSRGMKMLAVHCTRNENARRALHAEWKYSPCIARGMKLLVVHCTRNEIARRALHAKWNCSSCIARGMKLLVVHCTRNEINADTHRTLYVESKVSPLIVFFMLCFGPWQCRPTQIVNNCSCKRKTVVLYQAVYATSMRMYVDWFLRLIVPGTIHSWSHATCM